MHQRNVRRWPWRGLAATALATAVATAVAGCGEGDGGTEPPPPTPTNSITLTLSAGTMSVIQGRFSLVSLAVERSGEFVGPVNLELVGAPAGLTGTFTPSSLLAGHGTSTLSIAATEGAATQETVLTVRATGRNVASRTASLAVTVTPPPPPDLALIVNPSRVTVLQGGGAETRVLLARVNGLTGDVALAVEGAPPGLNVTLAASSTAESSVDITIEASGTLAVGTYNLVVSGTATALTGARGTPLVVTVAAP